MRVWGWGRAQGHSSCWRIVGMEKDRHLAGFSCSCVSCTEHPLLGASGRPRSVWRSTSRVREERRDEVFGCGQGSCVCVCAACWLPGHPHEARGPFAPGWVYILSYTLTWAIHEPRRPCFLASPPPGGWQANPPCPPCQTPLLSSPQPSIPILTTARDILRGASPQRRRPHRTPSKMQKG